MPVLLVVRVEHVLVYFARLASETGRAVAAGNLVTQVLHFRITSESSGLSNRSRRGKSEHYRAASPLTAGRPKVWISNLRSKIQGDDKCNRKQTSLV